MTSHEPGTLQIEVCEFEQRVRELVAKYPHLTVARAVELTDLAMAGEQVNIPEITEEDFGNYELMAAWAQKQPEIMQYYSPDPHTAKKINAIKELRLLASEAADASLSLSLYDAKMIIEQFFPSAYYDGTGHQPQAAGFPFPTPAKKYKSE